MKNLEAIIDRIHSDFETRTSARDQALSHARLLTRHCAHAIRAIHRNENDEARKKITEAHELVDELTKNLVDHPDLYYAGYTQDALKEFAEATITIALINNDNLPTPEELGITYMTYVKGLAESAGELRRRTLDILRHGYSEDAERLLDHMDEIYASLVTMDYPDAITGGLRRLTDIVRGVTERTRGDMTLSIRQQRLEAQLQKVEAMLSQSEGD